MRSVRRGILGAAGVLLAMGGVGLASHTFASPAHGTSSLRIVNVGSAKYGFSPKTITVSKGSKLVWKNTTSVEHTITSDKSGAFNKTINAGKSVTITLSKAGTYTYHCAIHPYMTGKIVVH